MLLAQLQAFVEIARQGTVREAAGILHVGQPALTARIAALERDVGARLFERSPKGMRLTPAGRALLPHAERAIASVEAGIARARDVEHGRLGEVVIGAAPAVSAYVLPELIARLRRRLPDLRTLVRTGHSEEIVELVAGGEVDVGLVRELLDRRLVSHPLFEEELVLVVPADHPFAGARRLPVERLRESMLILFDRTSSYYEMTHVLFRGAGVVPGGTIEVDNIETAKRMTLRGLGIAFLPSTAVADALADSSLVVVRVDGVGPLRRRVVAVVRARGTATVPPELWELLHQIPTLVQGATPA